MVFVFRDRKLEITWWQLSMLENKQYIFKLKNINTSILTNPVNNYTARHTSFRFIVIKLSFDKRQLNLNSL